MSKTSQEGAKSLAVAVLLHRGKTSVKIIAPHPVVCQDPKGGDADYDNANADRSTDGHTMAVFGDFCPKSPKMYFS